MRKQRTFVLSLKTFRSDENFIFFIFVFLAMKEELSGPLKVESIEIFAQHY
jgi:hypothetical protein